jgi:hypothetical protein
MELSEAQIKAIGSEILYELGETFNEILDRQLRKTQGEDWFEKSFKTKSKNRQEALRRSGRKDPHTLLHQVTTERNAIFRAALGKEFKLGDLKYLQGQLEQITKARNKWSHPDGIFSQQDLLELVKPIHRVLGNRNYALGQRCEDLIRSLEEQKIGSLSHFSRAFGAEFKTIERSNYLLRQELMRYRDSSIERYSSQRATSLEKATLSHAELEELLDDFENLLVTQEREQLEKDHVRRDREFSAKLDRWLLEYSLLMRLFDEDAFGVSLQSGEASGVVGPHFSPLKESEIFDLMTVSLNQLLPIAEELTALRSELGPGNCVCYWCELGEKYQLLPGSLNPDLFSGAVMQFFYSVTDPNVLDLIDNFTNEWIKSNNLRDDFMDWIFSLPSD